LLSELKNVSKLNKALSSKDEFI